MRSFNFVVWRLLFLFTCIYVSHIRKKPIFRAFKQLLFIFRSDGYWSAERAKEKSNLLENLIFHHQAVKLQQWFFEIKSTAFWPFICNLKLEYWPTGIEEICSFIQMVLTPKVKLLILNENFCSFDLERFPTFSYQNSTANFSAPCRPIFKF